MYKKLGLYLAATFFLAACGAGGGSTASNSSNGGTPLTTQVNVSMNGGSSGKSAQFASTKNSSLLTYSNGFSVTVTNNFISGTQDCTVSSSSCLPATTYYANGNTSGVVTIPVTVVVGANPRFEARAYDTTFASAWMTTSYATSFINYTSPYFFGPQTLSALLTGYGFSTNLPSRAWTTPTAKSDGVGHLVGYGATQYYVAGGFTSNNTGSNVISILLDSVPYSAVMAANESAYPIVFATVTGTPAAEGTTYAGQPGQFTAIPASGTGVNLSWSAVTTTTGNTVYYNVYYYDVSGANGVTGSGSVVANFTKYNACSNVTSWTALTCSVINLTTGHPYQFAVTAYIPGRLENPSPVVMVTPAAINGYAPNTPAVAFGSANQQPLTVSWKAPTTGNAPANYNVYYSNTPPGYGATEDGVLNTNATTLASVSMHAAGGGYGYTNGALLNVSGGTGVAGVSGINATTGAATAIATLSTAGWGYYTAPSGAVTWPNSSYVVKAITATGVTLTNSTTYFTANTGTYGNIPNFATTVASSNPTVSYFWVTAAGAQATIGVNGSGKIAIGAYNNSGVLGSVALPTAVTGTGSTGDISGGLEWSIFYSGTQETTSSCGLTSWSSACPVGSAYGTIDQNGTYAPPATNPQGNSDITVSIVARGIQQDGPGLPAFTGSGVNITTQTATGGAITATGGAAYNVGNILQVNYGCSTSPLVVVTSVTATGVVLTGQQITAGAGCTIGGAGTASGYNIGSTTGSGAIWTGTTAKDITIVSGSLTAIGSPATASGYGFAPGNVLKVTQTTTGATALVMVSTVTTSGAPVTLKVMSSSTGWVSGTTVKVAGNPQIAQISLTGTGTSASGVAVVAGGWGYDVGELLNLSLVSTSGATTGYTGSSSNFVPAQVQVTSVSGGGAITGVSLTAATAGVGYTSGTFYAAPVDVGSACQVTVGGAVGAQTISISNGGTKYHVGDLLNVVDSGTGLGLQIMVSAVVPATGAVSTASIVTQSSAAYAAGISGTALNTPFLGTGGGDQASFASDTAVNGFGNAIYSLSLTHSVGGSSSTTVSPSGITLN
ncbi:MAG: hypothetical protein HY280_02240 [Nitrospinae bacterium]|nr:hypothetical protein [Nitrospinota bacterium]